MSDASAAGTRPALRDPGPVAAALIAFALLWVALFLVLPLVVVVQEAFARGAPRFLAALSDPDALASIRLTLLVAAVSVPVNLVLGVAAAWAVAKHEFRGRELLLALLDLPIRTGVGSAALQERGAGGVWSRELRIDSQRRLARLAYSDQQDGSHRQTRQGPQPRRASADRQGG